MLVPSSFVPKPLNNMAVVFLFLRIKKLWSHVC